MLSRTFLQRQATPLGVALLWILTPACADGDRTGASGGSPGATSGGASSGAATGGTSSGGTSSGGTASGGTASGDASSPGGGSGGALASDCAVPTNSSILGDYEASNGATHWLRQSATALTYTRLPPGTALEALPTLELVTQLCDDSGFFVVQSANGTFGRRDFARVGPNVWLCHTVEGLAHEIAAVDHEPADPQSLTSGCAGGAWTALTRQVTP